MYDDVVIESTNEYTSLGEETKKAINKIHANKTKALLIQNMKAS